MNGWIDFKQLRAQLDFETVLRHYGVVVNRKGDQHLGFCPLPSHQGKKNSPSFSANLVRGIFQCFGCGAKGNILEFACIMTNNDPKNGAAFRQVAIELEKKFSPTQKLVRHQRVFETGEAPEAAEPAIINAPLDFELKGLDVEHPYLKGRGFSLETIAHFGLGYCSRGLFKGRIAIPLHDGNAKLIGYAGRVVEDSQISDKNPRYRLPGDRKRDGKVFEFRKTLFLYNGFRIKAPADNLVIVEGFTGVWWLHQHGFPAVVATMGCDCSEKQSELILSLVKPSGNVWILPDSDAAGVRFAELFLRMISPFRFIRWVKLDEDSQPTDLAPEKLRNILTF